MKKLTIALLSLLILSVSLVSAGCGKKSETIYFYNWQEYIDPDVLEMFKEETGITVVMDTFDTNEAMYMKVSKSGGYDIILPSEYMIERMIKEDLLEKLNMSNIPNYMHIDETFKGMFFDQDNEYFVPYMWGTVGIMYDSSRVTETVDSWDILWDEKYKGQIYMYNSVRDSMMPALIKLGYSINTQDINELNEAAQLLIAQKPLVQTYLAEPVKDKMIGREGLFALIYSGDAMYCQSINPDLDFIVPKEGSNIFVDGLCIPKTAKNKEGAEKFIDFLCRPEIAALNSEYIGYATANSAALEFIDPEMLGNPIYWASDEIIERCDFFIDLGSFKTEYDRVWNEIMISK